MRTPIHEDDARKVASLAENRHGVSKLNDPPGARVIHLARHACRKAKRVRIDVMIRILLPLRRCPRLVWNFSVSRIDDLAVGRTEAVLSTMFFDALPTGHRRRVPQSLQVGVAVRPHPRFERLGLGHRTGMKVCGVVRATTCLTRGYLARGGRGRQREDCHSGRQRHRGSHQATA